ncbi:MAG: TMEM165/GDT1 family protein [Firmicutes bacterium]|nr:TMEM165/GDT1 family protein [Bacillota bacterium]
MSLKLLTWLTTYVLIILCELGDKTQMAVLMIASNNPTKRWLIFGASALALTLCVTIEVTMGVTIANYIGPAVINKTAGFVFFALGILTLIQHIKVPEKMLIEPFAIFQHLIY